MRYPEFRGYGRCVRYGVVEAGNCAAVGPLKRSGIYWTVGGADAILAPRSSVVSGNYEQLREERAEDPPIQAEIKQSVAHPGVGSIAVGG